MIGVFLDNVHGECHFQYSIVKIVDMNMLQMGALRKYKI